MTIHFIRASLLRLFLACCCLGVWGHACAGEYDSVDKAVLAASQGIDSAYREALILYQKKCYDNARSKLNYVLSVLNTDSATRSWRESRGAKPTRQDAQLLLNKINAKPASEPCVRGTGLPQAADDSGISAAAVQHNLRLQQIQEDAQKALAERETARSQLSRRIELERQKAVEERKREIAERERRLKAEIEQARKEAERAAREATSELKKKQEQRRLEMLAIQKRAQEQALRQRALLKEQEEQRRQEVMRIREEGERTARLDADRSERQDRLEQVRREQLLRDEELAARDEEDMRRREEKVRKRRHEVEILEEEYDLKEREEALRQRRRLGNRGEEALPAHRQAASPRAEDGQMTRPAGREQEFRTTQLIKERDALIEESAAHESVSQSSVDGDAGGKLSAAMKGHDDAEKIRRIDALWRVSKKLYNEGMYDEAIKGFEQVVALEGNPRIKYTPEAERLIQRAREKSLSAEEARAVGSLKVDIGNTEDKMMKEVYETQIPPYVDPPRKKIKQDQVPLIETPIIRKKLQDKRVTMDFDKVGLKSVIKFFSQESGVNFVASQKVLNLDPTVTARFDDANVIEAVKYVTKSLGLVYRIDKEIVWIADPEEVANEAMETRVYYLLKGGGLFTDFTPVSGGSTGLGGSSAQINKIYTIEDTLKEVVSWPADAKLTYDKRLNALIARNTPQNLQMLEEMLYSLDIEPVQVLIEARFIEIDITDTKDFGIELKLNDDFAFDKDGGDFRSGLASNSGFDFTSFTRASEGLNFTYKGVLTYPQFQAVLHALEETKRIKTLSSPRITTLNSQMASIKVVDEWIYPTRYEFEIVQFDVNGDGDFNDAGETAYQNVPKDFLRRDVGIILKVVPTVGADKKTINLSLIPEVSEATADAFQYSGNVTLPLFTSRNLSTTVVVNSADTVVLGGLVKESRTKTITKVPVLGSLPVIGNLFKKDSDVVQRKNLMIFVTAKVLSPSGEEVIVSGN